MSNRFDLNRTLAENAANGLILTFGGLDQEGELIGVVLGTGWGDALALEEAKSCSFDVVRGMPPLPSLSGHQRRVLFGHLGDRRVIALQGRVHLNEAPPYEAWPSQATRLQVEMLMCLGVRKLILTCAAGSLATDLWPVGAFVPIRGFLSLFAPAMPLFAGEFCSPEDTLRPKVAEAAIRAAGMEARPGVYAMVRGPFFEGRAVDKSTLYQMRADLVGMSCLPEACIAALYGAEVAMVAFVTNGSTEVHSHEENQAKAHAASASMGAVLAEMIARF